MFISDFHGSNTISLTKYFIQKNHKNIRNKSMFYELNSHYFGLGIHKLVWSLLLLFSSFLLGYRRIIGISLTVI